MEGGGEGEGRWEGLIGKPTRRLKIFPIPRPFLTRRRRRLTEIASIGGCTLSIDVIGHSLEINGR